MRKALTYALLGLLAFGLLLGTGCKLPKPG